MNQTALSPDHGSGNPLAAFTRSLPGAAGAPLSIAARIAGAALAMYIVIDQSYDRTQFFAASIAVLALVSLVPNPVRVFGSGVSAGVLFFGGAMLLGQGAGAVMLAAGTVAIGATLAGAYRTGEDIGAGVGGFFFGLGATVAVVVVVLLAVTG